MIDVSGVRSSCETSAKNSFLSRSVSASARRRSSTSATSSAIDSSASHELRVQRRRGGAARTRTSRIRPARPRSGSTPTSAASSTRVVRVAPLHRATHAARERVQHPVHGDRPAQRPAERLQDARDDVLARAAATASAWLTARWASRARSWATRSPMSRTKPLICHVSPTRSGETETSIVSRRPSRCTAGISKRRVVACAWPAARRARRGRHRASAPGSAARRPAAPRASRSA